MRKVIYFFVFLILIVIAVLLGGKIYLFAKMLLGNDLVVTLSTDNENLFLINGQEKMIEFKSQAIVNPFCSSYCSYDFVDLNKGLTIENGKFNINPAKTVSKEFTIKVNDDGFGQDLYNFIVKCKSAKTSLCHTTGEEKIRSVLITVNYNLSEENQKFKNESKEQIASMIKDLDYMNLNIGSLNSTIGKTNQIIDLGNAKNDINNLSSEIAKVNNDVYELKSFWENQKYNELRISEIIAEKNFYATEINFIAINSSISSKISNYNNLIENLTSAKEKLIALVQTNVSSLSALKINNLIEEFNDNLVYFNQNNNSLTNKENQINNLTNNIELILISTGNKSEKCCFANETINEINILKIVQVEASPSSLILDFKEPAPKCCYNGQCGECCDNKCRQNKSLYPIIFIHGHEVSRGVSPETKLDVFTEIQEKTEDDGYINAGPFIIEPKEKRIAGIWGIPNKPISVRASYYFDVNEELEQSSIVQTKSEDINNYAIRLKDLINGVKFKTNKDKVIIIASSMGGLVIRKYIQLFGEDSVDKIILIGTPNNGISGRTKLYCPIFGSKLECDDMNKNSLFMNKLNNGEVPGVKIYNIIGTGCATNGEDGDGIVEKTSAYLEYAENFYIKGKCDEIKLTYLHNEMLKPDKYPEVYGIINETLKNTE